MTFLYYLLIGTLFTLSLDIMSDFLETKQRFNNLERFVVILFWPIAMFVFIKELWNAKNGKL